MLPSIPLEDLAALPGVVRVAFVEYGQPIAQSCSVQAVCMVFVYILVRIFKPDERDKVALADTLFSLVFFPLLAYTAVTASWELRHDVHSRWQGTSSWSEFYMVLYVSRMMCHVLIQPLEAMTWPFLIMMTFHHLMSMGCYILGLGYGRCHFWGCLDGCCEITTVFLNFLYMMNVVEVKGKRLKEYLPDTLVAAVGFVLWLSFLICRLMLFPYWLFSFYQDMQDAPEKTISLTTKLERVVYPGSTVILLLLSTSWFIPLTTGMWKSMQKAMGKKIE